MRLYHVLFAALVFAATITRADPPDLAFKPAGEGYYQFNTGVFRGKVRLDGRSQAVSSLVHVPTGFEVAKAPGLLSYYRVFSAGTRYGRAARNWPIETKLLPDGALQVFWPAAEEHPLQMTAVYRWKTPDTLDLETSVKPQEDMPKLEIFLSSYFAPGLQALVYVQPNRFTKGPPQFLSADFNPMVDGAYLMFPRDRESVLTIFDGRWEIPPNPVQWAVGRLLASPVAMRRDPTGGLAAVLMAPPEDCFAVATPYNKQPPDNVAGHSSLYLSLFGRDVAAGQTARAHTRLALGKNVTDQQAVRWYQQYIEERRQFIEERRQ